MIDGFKATGRAGSLTMAAICGGSQRQQVPVFYLSPEGVILRDKPRESSVEETDKCREKTSRFFKDIQALRDSCCRYDVHALSLHLSRALPLTSVNEYTCI